MVKVVEWAERTHLFLRILSHRTGLGVGVASAAAIVYFLASPRPDFRHISFLWLMSAATVWGVTWWYCYSLKALQRKLNFVNGSMQGQLSKELKKFLINSILLEHRRNQTVSGAIHKTQANPAKLADEAIVGAFVGAFRTLKDEQQEALLKPVLEVIKQLIERRQGGACPPRDV